MSNQPKDSSPANAATTIIAPPSHLASTRKAIKFMMGGAVLVLVAACGGFYVLNGQIQSIAAVEANKEAQVGSSQQIAERYSTTLASYNDACDQLQFLEDPIKPENFVPTLLPQMQKLAQTDGCNVISMKPGTAAAPGGSTTAPAPKTVAAADAQPTYQIVPLDMSITGTYSQIMRFVYSLTKFPKIVTLKALNLSPGGSSTDGSASSPANMSLSATVKLDTYVFPMESGKMLPEEPVAQTGPRMNSLSQNHQIVNDIVAQSNGAVVKN